MRDRDRSYGEVFVRRVRAMGIRDRPTSPRSPWQNAYAERLIGSIRRECIDHVIVFGERHLRHLLRSYLDYYNETRTHLSLDKDAPISRAIQAVGRIVGCPVLGGLHHQYVRDLICGRDRWSGSHQECEQSRHQTSAHQQHPVAKIEPEKTTGYHKSVHYSRSMRIATYCPTGKVPSGRLLSKTLYLREAKFVAAERRPAAMPAHRDHPARKLRRGPPRHHGPHGGEEKTCASRSRPASHGLSMPRRFVATIALLWQSSPE